MRYSDSATPLARKSKYPILQEFPMPNFQVMDAELPKTHPSLDQAQTSCPSLMSPETIRERGSLTGG